MWTVRVSHAPHDLYFVRLANAVSAVVQTATGVMVVPVSESETMVAFDTYHDARTAVWGLRSDPQTARVFLAGEPTPYPNVGH